MARRDKMKSEISETLRAIGSRQSLGIWAGAFGLSVLTGPFGTFRDLALGPRALFWGLVVTASVIVGHLARGLASVLVHPRHPILFDVVAVTSMTVLLSPAIWGIGRLFEPVFVIKMASFLEIFLCVFSVALIIFALRRVLPGIGQ